jgi:hypothetical protein
LKNRLLLLNLTLLVATGVGVWRLRENWLAARAREPLILYRSVAARPAGPIPASPPISGVLATSYADVAQKMLFAKDRNPTVVVEVKPVAPKPMPKLPVLYGVMNLLDGSTAIMSEKPEMQHVGVRPGDKIGEFTLVAITRDDVIFGWEGKEVTKKIDEMIDRTGPVQTAHVGTTPRPTSGNPPAPPPVQQPRSEPTPGVEVAQGIRACQPGDTSPAGTVADGYRKLVTPTPFGNSCRWVPK